MSSVLLVLDDLAPGGPTTTAARLAPALREAGHGVSVLGLDPSADAPRPAFGEVPLLPAPRSDDGLLALARPARLRRLIAADGTDVVVIFGARALLATALAARAAGARTVAVFLEEGVPGPLGRLLARPLFRTVDRVLVPTAALAERIAALHGFHPRRIERVPPLPAPPRGAARIAASPATRAAPGGPRLRALLRAGETEALDRLIEALAILGRHQPDLEVRIGGRGPTPGDFHLRLEATGLEGRCHWDEVVEDVPAFLGAGDLFVLPRPGPRLPLGALEAQSAGCAVVADFGPGLEALGRPERDFISVPEGPPSFLADALDALQEEPERREAVARSGEEAARRREEASPTAPWLAAIEGTARGASPTRQRRRARA